MKLKLQCIGGDFEDGGKTKDISEDVFDLKLEE